MFNLNIWKVNIYIYGTMKYYCSSVIELEYMEYGHTYMVQWNITAHPSLNLNIWNMVIRTYVTTK